MQRETVGKTILVAAILCVVCSVLVSTAAVQLRPLQENNREMERMRNILVAAGLYEPGIDIRDTFDNKIEQRVVDLETGEYVDPSVIDPATYDQRQASKDPELSIEIPPEKDIAGIRRREKYSVVYLVEQEGELNQVILPIYGKGLWSTLYAFLSLENDLNTIKGITFYEHGETPGLGGEVENPNWLAIWPGKQAFSGDGTVQIEVTKNVQPGSNYQIDALSGSTITSRGVTNMLHYWLSSEGFKPYLDRLRQANTAGGNNG